MKTKIITVTALLVIAFSATATVEQHFKSLDSNQDGFLDFSEHTVHSNTWMDKKGMESETKRAKINENTFKSKDADDDGKISLKEWQTAQESYRKKSS